MDISIIALDRAREEELLRMWRTYQEFYRVAEIDVDRNREHVREIVKNPSLGRIHLALRGSEVGGFSTVYFTYASTRSCKIALLNDLFVVPEQRCSGVGRALVDHALDLARAEGIRYVRWTTEAANTSAQQLYARYGEPSLWKMYSVDVLRAGGHE